MASALLLAVLMVACTSDGSEEESAVSPSEPWDTHGLVPATGPHREVIIEYLRAEYDLPYTEESLAFHREIFADGEVTYEEYERAVYATIECARDRGFEVEGPWRGLSVQIGRDITKILAVTYVDRPDGHLAIECQEMWSLRIETIWVIATAPTEQEVQIWLEAAWDCASERGLPLSDPPTIEEAQDATRQGCQPWLALPPR